MKKFLYLCGMMLMGLNMMAQIDLNDRNWDTLFMEDFSIVRDWSENKWQDGSTDATSFWRCFAQMPLGQMESLHLYYTIGKLTNQAKLSLV